MKKQESFVSVVLVIKNNFNILTSYIKELSDDLNQSYSDYEIVIIDQSSTDETSANIDNLLTEYKSIRYILLSSEVTEDVAVAAGYENAIGDFVVNLDIQRDPVSLVNQLVTLCKQGNDIVLGVTKQPTTAMYNIIRPYVKRILRSIGYDFPRDFSGSMCLSRRTVNAVTESGRFYHKLYVRIAKTGYKSIDFKYDSKVVSNKKDIVTGIKEALHFTIFNSTKPLRWMSTLGVVGSLLAFVFAVYSIIVNIFTNNVTQGWTTLVLFSSVLFALLFTMLAFFGEYLARLLNDRSEHRSYSVVYEKNSNVMLDENRFNVLYDSESDDLNIVKTGRNK
ncbi:glycosyl transferase family 2 [Photobacterium leiognathi subsp. mandapamensis]|uniref:glycosyltransferase n=1 Tax=Photobacterium leiognathi TaxID=553611 RepID=UPI000D17B6C7|nr:glycosyltransferase [Photobacterium leiognathi]PSW65245.1 glycosyl transferase family 2 [Photobacterium leiognathi subsp. mandapamensis]